MIDRTAYLKAIESGNPLVACNAITRLYKEQTASEQAAGQTTESNGRGFNATDADILTSFAQQIARNKWMKEHGQAHWPVPLSDAQLRVARKKLPKYVSQLIRLAEADASAKAEAPPAPKAACPEVLRDLMQEGNNLRWKTPAERAAESGTRWGIDFQPSQVAPVDLGELTEFEVLIGVGK